MVACCPFHSEKTPSFTIFGQGNSYFCFGCSAGGDVISYIMKMENVDYLSAVEILANRYGMTVPQDSFAPKINTKLYYEMNRCAARFFYDTLKSPAGEKGRAYLRERGIDDATVKRFGIGYASDSFSALSSHLASKGYTAEDMKTAFLAGINKYNKPFDYFRNRVIFPNIDVTGRVVAFSGRLVGPVGENDRKYLNTSDTPVFKKSRSLFALNLAKESKENSLILCEGPMDVIALHRAGFTNAVATQGTALTSEQARIMQRYAETVYICYDNDEAGRKASEKAIKILDEAGIKVKVISLRDGAKDPDEFIKKFGRETFSKLIKDSDGQIEYIFSEVLKKYNLSVSEDKLEFIKEMCVILSKKGSALEREIYLNKTSELTGVDVQVLKKELSRTYKSLERKTERERISADTKAAIGMLDRINPDKIKNKGSAQKEEAILGILMLRNEYLFDPKVKESLKSDNFTCEFTKKAMDSILSLAEENESFDIGLLGEKLSADEISALMRMMVARQSLGDNSQKILLQLFSDLEKEKISFSETEDLNEMIEKIKRKKK